MNGVRVILALVVAFAMIFIARLNSRGQPDYVEATDNGYTFAMTTVPKIQEGEFETMRLSVTPDPPAGHHVVYKTTGPKRGKSTPIEKYYIGPSTLRDLTNDDYFTSIRAGERGKREYYVFEVIDDNGKTVARFTRDDGEPFLLKYIGHVPLWVLVPHIGFLLITVFCVVYVAFYAVGAAAGNEENLKPMARWTFLAVLATFIGGYPIGWAMNWYAFAGFWEGVPFGTDATDNKTQLLFVYLLLVMFGSMGSLSNGRFGRNLFAPKTLGWLGIGSFIVLLAIYLIPHSIQFSPLVTYSVCYSFIGLMLLIYLVGRLRGPKPTPAA